MVSESVLQNTSDLDMVTPGSSSTSSTMNSLWQSASKKLSRENFILWKAQILTAVRGALLYGYLDGTVVIEPPQK
jgi:hypothetical protein